MTRHRALVALLVIQLMALGWLVATHVGRWLA